jgi:seryl-tRNA synthetase
LLSIPPQNPHSPTETLKYLLMIDLGFMRANLPLVEEKLRARGMDPSVALGSFTEVDQQRRDAITRVETLKAQRSPRFAKQAQTPPRRPSRRKLSKLKSSPSKPPQQQPTSACAR